MVLMLKYSFVQYHMESIGEGYSRISEEKGTTDTKSLDCVTVEHR
jgi:hypothetical protein